MQNPYLYVSRDAIDAARADHAAGDRQCCDCCKPYAAPGFVLNANQWVNCFQCNATAGGHRSIDRHDRLKAKYTAAKRRATP